MEDLSREKEHLESELSRKSAAFRDLQKPESLTPERLQKALPAGTALVDFLEYQHCSPSAGRKGKEQQEWRLVAFVVQHDNPIVQVDLGPLQPVAGAVDAYREQVGVGKTEPAAAHAATLRRLVWQPLEPHLKDTHTVLVCPDGALTRFPLAALPGSKPGTYLLEERALAVVPVPQLLPDLLTKKEPDSKAGPALLLVGDVDYGALPGQREVADARSAPRGERADLLRRWKALPDTRAEIVAIKDSFQRRFRQASVTELREKHATETALRTQASRHRFLHLATHGFFAPAELKSALAASKAEKARPGDLFTEKDVTGFHPGLLSGLVLAGANRTAAPGQDDGILTSLEIATLDLGGVDLSVLSACETGLGETAGGEGLLGVQRAFQVAGARSAVATLWQVDDAATRQLMSRFYANLWRSEKPLSKLEALREAQLWMLREGVAQGVARGFGPVKVNDPNKKDQAKPEAKQRAAPFFWAGFVLSGDWR
jgi:CHAT domain-containing protein